MISLRSEAIGQSRQGSDPIVSLPRFAVAVEQEGEGAYELANFNYHLAYGGQPDSTEKKEQDSYERQEQISTIKKVNRILEEFDGGPSAGMKTRKFLRLSLII